MVDMLVSCAGHAGEALCRKNRVWRPGMRERADNLEEVGNADKAPVEIVADIRAMLLGLRSAFHLYDAKIGVWTLPLGLVHVA